LTKNLAARMYRHHLPKSKSMPEHVFKDPVGGLCFCILHCSSKVQGTPSVDEPGLTPQPTGRLPGSLQPARRASFHPSRDGLPVDAAPKRRPRCSCNQTDWIQNRGSATRRRSYIASRKPCSRGQMRCCEADELPRGDDFGLLPELRKMLLIAGNEVVSTGFVSAFQKYVVVRVARHFQAV
jgi:hypothetical protein